MALVALVLIVVIVGLDVRDRRWEP